MQVKGLKASLLPQNMEGYQRNSIIESLAVKAMIPLRLSPEATAIFTLSPR